MACGSLEVSSKAVALHHVNINISQNKTDYLKQLDYIHQLNKHEDVLRNQIKLIHQAKQAMVQKMLSGR